MVTQNLTDGTVAIEPDLAFDPSHVEAHSSFTVVETVIEDGNKVKKAVGKMSKRCSCLDKEQCHHEWEVTDQGCGVVVKSNHKKYWAHQASFVGFPQSHVPLDAAAVNYAATNGGTDENAAIGLGNDRNETKKVVYQEVIRMRVLCYNEPLKRIYFFDFLDDARDFNASSAVFNQILTSVRFLD